MTQKREHCQRDAHFDKAVRMLAEVVLPQPNFFPPSLHLMEKVLNVQPPESCAYHVCRNDCHSWDKIPKAAWPAHRDDTCPECGEGRFILTTPSGVSCLRPAKEFWYLGLQNVVGALYADPEWVASRARAAALGGTPADLKGASMYARVNAATGSKLLQESACGFELGFDFCQIFTFAQHSTGCLFLRSTAVMEEDKGKSRWIKLLLVIPGKSEPKKMSPYVRFLIKDLQDFGPSGDGMRVQQIERCPEGPTEQPAAAAAAAQPAPPSHAAVHKQGQRFEDGSAMRFAGYARPSQQELLGQPDMLVGDDRLQVSDQLQRQRADLVERHHQGQPGGILPKTAGCTGASVIAHFLDYISYNDLFILPIFHAGLFGLVKKFVGLLLEDYASESERSWWNLTRDSKAILRKRAGDLKLTSDFGRPYKDVVHYHKGYMLDDWLHFMETLSIYLLTQDLMHPRMWEMWTLLRASLLHYFRVQVVDGDPVGPGSTFHPAERQAAHQKLLQYAAMVEEYLPNHMLTYNMHILACRLAKQELARGCTGKDGELWVERGMQRSKANVKYHADIRAGPLYDTGDDSTHTQLLRKGRVMAGAARAAAKQQLLRFLERMPQAGWGAEVPARGLQLHQFPMAHKGGDEILWAKSCGGTRTRVSFRCKLRFLTRNENEQPFIAEVQHFVRATRPDGTVKRLAVCRLMKAAESAAGLLKVSSVQQAAREVAMVEVDMIDCKLVTAESAGCLYGMVYGNTSGMG